MPYIPHTDAEVDAMLETIGVSSVQALFDEIPRSILCQDLPGIASGMGEMEATRLMQARAQQDVYRLNFIGAGAYEHHIPACVWDIVSRGEFMTAYTPYQAEASQGTLQVIYEYQSMMTQLTGMDVSNASLYDGACALAEALLMSVRVQKKSSRRILLPENLHPAYRAVCSTLTSSQNLALETIPFDQKTGGIDLSALRQYENKDATALVIAQPNFFGVLDEVDALTDWAHHYGMLVIAVVNPTSLGLLKPPSQWGSQGADIVVGEGQPLGVPLSSGGPYFGFMCCRKSLVRQMPGRIIGKTEDRDGKIGFTLTLQAREQHIRRSKATSNICTNQGLVVTAATIYLSLLGAKGLREVAASSHKNMLSLLKNLETLDGVECIFTGPCFHEAVLRLPVEPAKVLDQLAKEGILGGLDISQWFPQLKNAILLCTTETKTTDDIERLAFALRKAL